MAKEIFIRSVPHAETSPSLPEKYFGKKAITNFSNTMFEGGVYSSNTIQAYGRDVRQMLQTFCSDPENNNFDWRVVTPGVINNYIDHLKNDGQKGSTVARKFASVRAFFCFLEAEGVIRNNPTENSVKHNFSSIRTPRILNIDEVEKLKNLYSKKWSLGDYRDQAMLYLMLSTGITVSELVSTDIQNLDLESGNIQIVKGNSVRTLKLDPETRSVLSHYVRKYRPPLINKFKNPEILFPSQKEKRLTRAGVWYRLRSLVADAGLENPEEITLYTFRHTFAIRELIVNKDVKSLQKKLGHSTRTNSRIYKQLLNLYVEKYPQDAELIKIVNSSIN